MTLWPRRPAQNPQVAGDLYVWPVLIKFLQKEHADALAWIIANHHITIREEALDVAGLIEALDRHKAYWNGVQWYPIYNSAGPYITTDYL